MTSRDLTTDLSENKTRSNYDYNFDRLSNFVYRIRLSLFASEIEMGVKSPPPRCVQPGGAPRRGLKGPGQL